MEVEVGPLKPWEQIMCGLTEIESGSRAEFRRSRGIPDDSDAIIRPLADRPRELPAGEGERSDAEIVGYHAGEVFTGIRPAERTRNSWQA